MGPNMTPKRTAEIIAEDLRLGLQARADGLTDENGRFIGRDAERAYHQRLDDARREDAKKR
jgi:hypothetical protein